MGPVAVVVIDILGEDRLELTPGDDQQAVEALPADGANEALGEGVGTRRSNRGLDDPSTNRGDDFIEGSDELASRSRIKNLTTRPSSSSVIARLRACWVTQLPIGCSVTPAKKTLRRSWSMKNST